MGRVWGILSAGAVLLIAAAAGFIVVPEHAPASRLVGYRPADGGQMDQALCQAEGPASGACKGYHPGHDVAVGLSRTAYDVLRVGTWACVIVGLILVLVGLITTWRRSTSAIP